MRKGIVFISMLAGIIFAFYACGLSSDERSKSTAPTDIKQFIETKCTTCHFTDRIYKKKRYPAEWMKLVKRMRSLNPTWVTEEDADRILDYLIKNNSKQE